MPEAQDNTVDIDTSGPGAEIELETQTQEENHETVQDNSESNDSTTKPAEQSDVQAAETTDQGQEINEEDKKKELEDYSEGVKKRIGKLTKKMREHERREEAAIEYARRVQQEKEELKARLSRLDTGYVSEMESRIKSSMEAAVAKLSKAREDGDITAEVAAQTEISKLGYEEARLADLRSRAEKEVKETNVQRPTLAQNNIQQEQPVAPDPKAQSWAEKNEWFGKDMAMTNTAISMHKILTDEEGYDPQSDEYYEEINKRIRLEFPHKFANVDSQTTQKPTQVVASANRSSRPGRKTVRLTSSQVAIAKKLGVPLEEYAKQLNITKE